MSKLTDLLKAWSGGPLGGGGADFSAVDEDIVLLNSHDVEFQGDGEDPIQSVKVGWDSDRWGLVVEGTVENETTELYVVEPGDTTTCIRLAAQASGPSLLFASNGTGFTIQQVGPALLHISADLQFVADRGVVLSSPDNSTHRVVVANDGTLSTEPMA